MKISAVESRSLLVEKSIYIRLFTQNLNVWTLMASHCNMKNQGNAGNYANDLAYEFIELIAWDKAKRHSDFVLLQMLPTVSFKKENKRSWATRAVVYCAVGTKHNPYIMHLLMLRISKTSSRGKQNKSLQSLCQKGLWSRGKRLFKYVLEAEVAILRVFTLTLYLFFLFFVAFQLSSEMRVWKQRKLFKDLVTFMEDFY